MRRLNVIIFCLLLSLIASAQTQHGIVKTRGRMVNGQWQPGDSLANAFVDLRDRSVVTKDNGTFSFPLRTKTYLVKKVTKKGYQLVDIDMLHKEFHYSINPIYLIMETSEQQQADLLAKERNFSRILQKQLLLEKDEIYALKTSNSEKDSLLRILYLQQEDNEKIIADMVKKYSSIDYDQLDEFYKQVSFHIENGELALADSLLNTKGSVFSGIEAYEHIQDANEKEKKKRTLIQHCVSKFDLFKIQHQKDSAFQYLNYIVFLDSLNMDRRFQLYNYMQEYLCDTNSAIEGYERCRLILEKEKEKDTCYLAKCYNALGVLYHHQKKDSLALEFMEKALNFRLQLFGPEHIVIANSFSNIGTLYNDQDKTDKALILYKNALYIRKKYYNNDTIQHSIATLYNNMGIAYRQKKEHDKALFCYHQVLNIKRELLLGKFHRSIARCYYNIACVYYDKKKYDFAIANYNESLSICDSVYGHQNDLTAEILLYLGDSYRMKKEYSKATRALEQSLQIFVELQKINRSNKLFEKELRNCCLSLGYTFLKEGEYANAEKYYQKAKLYDSNNEYIELIERNIKKIHQHNK